MAKAKNAFFVGKKILIIHYRIGKTDGVSLQIESWKKLLQRSGAIVALCAGPVSNGANFVIKNLEQQLNRKMFNLNQEAFGPNKTFKNKRELRREFLKQEVLLAKEFNKVLLKFQPEYVIISNIFSVGEHLPATGALTQVLDSWQIPTLAVHHDFYWENRRYHQPSSQFIKSYLERFYPPKRSWLKHCTINSIAQKELWKRKKVKSELLYDTFDFHQRAWKRDHFNHDLLAEYNLNRNDLVFLQATRIVRRKNIEIAIDLVKNLSDPFWLERLGKRKLYDGRRFNPKKNQIVLVLAGYAEKRDLPYLKFIKNYIKKVGIKAIFISDKIGGYRKKINGEKQYCLWDAYPFADMITYPSCYEGFGNQLLEAFFAKKPPIIFEYPVYQTDIENKGFQVVSLGDQVAYDSEKLAKIPQENMNNALEATVEVLTHPQKYQRIAKKNFYLGRKHFSFRKTLKIFCSLLLK